MESTQNARLGPPYFMVPNTESQILGGQASVPSSESDSYYNNLAHLEYYMSIIFLLGLIGITFYVTGELRYILIEAGSLSLPPAVGPGSCVVYNPLQGIYALHDAYGNDCNQSIPTYVASFSGNSLVNISSYGGSAGSRSVFGWIYYNSSGRSGSAPESVDAYGSNAPVSGLVIYKGRVCFEYGNGCYGEALLPKNIWAFVGYTLNKKTDVVTVYINGKVSFYESIPGFNLTKGIYLIGASAGPNCQSYCNYFNGYMSNVQFYDKALLPEQVSSLYSEGIGGPPISLSAINEWLPLNGNVNDYSGNIDTNLEKNLIFVTGWESTYASPSLCSYANLIIGCAA